MVARFIEKHRTAVVGAAIAGATVVLQALAEFDPNTIVDWKAWAVGIGAGVVRQVAIYLTGVVVGGQFRA